MTLRSLADERGAAARAEQLAPDITRLSTSVLSPNVYRVGGFVIDSGTRLGAARIIRQLREDQVHTLVLTHVHPPTQGGAHALCEALSMDLWCGFADVPTAKTGKTAAAQPSHWFNRAQQRAFAGPGHEVACALTEGSRVGEFTVLNVPGHSPGHIALWRARDRVLFVGDVITNQNVWTGIPGLREPPRLFTPDPAENWRSASRLAKLRPRLTLFSHGRPIRDPDALERFVSRRAPRA